MPALSIIVPVYKVEPYLRKCIDSILAQTFTDFELILVDDGSPDNCPAICEEYAERDSRIIVIHKENGGQASARNRGLDIAKGDYIGFVDSDDWIHPQMYEIMIDVLKEKCVDIVKCDCIRTTQLNIEINDISKTSIDDSIITLNRYIYVETNFYKYRGFISSMLWDKIYKRNIFENIRLPEGHIFEDAFILPDTLDKTQSIAVINIALYFYFQRDESTMHTEYSITKLLERDLVFLHYCEFFRHIKNREQYLIALNEYFIHFCRNKFFIWVKKPCLKCEHKILQKTFNKNAPRILFNRNMWKMKFMMLCLYVSPKIAYKIAKKYFPECLYEDMR